MNKAQAAHAAGKLEDIPLHMNTWSEAMQALSCEPAVVAEIPHANGG
jgi:hypothetical protein